MDIRSKLEPRAVVERGASRVKTRFAVGTQEMRVPPSLQALRDRARETEPVIDQFAHPALVIAAGGDIVAINTHAEALLGRDRSSLPGTPSETVLHCPAELAADEVQFVSARRGAYLKASGGSVPVDLMLSPDRDGRVVAACLPTIPDARQAIRDEEVAAIGHDLKNPLAAIMLELEMLAERGAPASATSFARMFKNVELASRLVSDLVDLAALDAARFELYRERVDLGVLVNEVVARMSASGRISLVQPSRPFRVLADALRLERVIGNLLDNALKYSPHDRSVEIELCDEGDHVCVVVSDQGPGLSPTDARIVFEKFRRVGADGQPHGHGLGLYVSRKIIEAHGGQMGVWSHLGRGSRFYFDLPLASARSAKHAT